MADEKRAGDAQQNTLGAAVGVGKNRQRADGGERRIPRD